MANIVFNIAKGSIAELANRVNSNDPTNSAFVVILLSAQDTDANMIDYNDVSALLGDAQVTEATFTNYVRQTVTSITVTVDDTNDRVDIDMADQTWSSAGGTLDNTIVAAVIAYDGDTTAGTDANLIPLVKLDINGGTGRATNGNDATLSFDNAYFYRAS